MFTLPIGGIFAVVLALLGSWYRRVVRGVRAQGLATPELRTTGHASLILAAALVGSTFHEIWELDLLESWACINVALLVVLGAHAAIVLPPRAADRSALSRRTAPRVRAPHHDTCPNGNPRARRASGPGGFTAPTLAGYRPGGCDA